MSKPIRVFFSPFTRRLMATRAYKEIEPGVIQVTGEAFDVTHDIGALIEHHQITFQVRTENKAGRLTTEVSVTEP